MATHTLQRAGVYCRLSYAPDGSLEKVERQEADCRDLARRLGWTISEAHVFVDNSRSAWQRNRKRPGWDALLAAVEDGSIDCIVVYHGDRLMRQPFDLEKLISAAEMKGVRIASVSGTRDLDNPDDRFILRIEVAQACRESDNNSRRTRRGLAARAAKGLTQVGGFRPFGYGVETGYKVRTDPVSGEEVQVPFYDTNQMVEGEVTILRGAVERLLAGQSKAGVVRWLNERSTTTEGNAWTGKTLDGLLLSPRISGQMERDGQLLPAAWPGIITPEQWEDIKALYRRNAERHRYPGRDRKYLLTGIAKCWNCQSTMRVKPQSGPRRKQLFYHCPACRKCSRDVEHTDAYIVGRVLRLLNSDAFLAEIYDASEQPEAAGQIIQLEERRKNLREQIENAVDHPDLDPMLAMASIASYDRKISELRQVLSVSTDRKRLTRLAGITLEQWGKEPIDVRSWTVKTLFDITVLPATWRGRGFDPKSLRVRRRQLGAGAGEVGAATGVEDGTQAESEADAAVG